jgi:hypothetical protein
MPTIIEKTTNGLYKHPDRTVATFPSGLVRIDQTYSCRNAAEATHRNTLAVGNELPEDDGYPAMDGAYIFPHCQQVRQGTGFTEFVASAYGRTTDQPTKLTAQTIEINITTISSTLSYKLLTFSLDIVLPTQENLNIASLGMDENLFEPFDFSLLFNSIFPRYPVSVEKTLVGNVFLNEPRFDDLGRIIAIDSVQNPAGRNYSVVFNVSSISTVVDLRPFDVFVRFPTIKVIAQTNYGKFTEYKLEVDYRIETQTEEGTTIEE